MSDADERQECERLLRAIVSDGAAIEDLRSWIDGQPGYDFMRGKTHVYDLWVVWVENGAFFRAGSDEQAPVYVAQGAYLPRDDSEPTRRLAAELAQSERASLWSLPKARKSKKA